MEQKRVQYLVSVTLTKEEKERLKAEAQKQQRTLSNLAGLMLRDAMARHEQMAA